jgi:sulfatase modifying factor 1
MRWEAIAVVFAAVAAGALAGRWMARDATSQPVVTAVAQQRDCAPVMPGGEHPGMAWIPGGSFTMGTDHGFPEEGPAVSTAVSGFWMDATEVTNAQFAEFVEATGYRTLAERGVRSGAAADAPAIAGSAVFHPQGEGEAMRSFVNWWQFVAGADWRHPEGPHSSIADRMRHPVVHVAREDALAYATWKGRSLPSEAQFEFAAQGATRRSASGGHAANTWQGAFPTQDIAADGHAGTAPVGCYGPDQHGLYDLIGNAWEWTSTPYYARHEAIDPQHPQGFDPAQPGERAVAVVKGGSFLCSPDYCMRYRPESRIGQATGLGAAHIGFRTVLAP